MENAAFGKRLKEARMKKKLTQEQLAEKADISAIYLSELERGEKSPSMTVLAVHEADRKPPLHHQRITEGEQSPSKRRRKRHVRFR